MNTYDLLVVGAGYGQLPAIRAARKMGVRVITIDRDPTAPGMAEADAAYVVDVTDVEGAIRVARDASVRGAMTMQSDLPVPTVGAINDALDLAGVSSETARYCSNKIRTRQVLQAAGVPQPAFCVAKELQEALTACTRIGFPCIVKSPDSSGSRGVVKVVDLDGVDAAYAEARKHSRDGRVLIEEFAEGKEFGAQSFSLDGVVKAVHVHDDVLSGPPYMIPVGHSYPSTIDPARQHHVKVNLAAALQALGVVHGPANIDFILDPSGGVRIIEIGARIGATCLPELTSIHTRTDWVAAAVRAALGERPDVADRGDVPVAAFILEAPNDGRLVGWQVPLEVRDDPRVLEWEVTAQRGESISRLRKGTDRIGKVLATGADASEAVHVADRFRHSITFDVR